MYGMYDMNAGGAFEEGVVGETQELCRRVGVIS